MMMMATMMMAMTTTTTMMMINDVFKRKTLSKEISFQSLRPRTKWHSQRNDQYNIKEICSWVDKVSQWNDNSLVVNAPFN